MLKQTLTFISLFLLCASLTAQIPYAFRYQASVRDNENNPIIEEVQFDIALFNDADAVNQIYSESHIIKPDTNGLVAFSIGEGTTNDDFSAIVWAEGPYYIQVLLDGEEISYSQLVSVPYAMHSQTASSLYDLQTPVLSNDPTTKHYVDEADSSTIDSLSQTIKISYQSTIDSLTKALDETLELSKKYADSLSISPKDLEVSLTGDTLIIGGKKLVISGLSSNNMEAYDKQLVLGGSYNESLNSIFECSDSSIILLATTQSGNGDIENFKGDADIWVLKISRSLEIEWSRTLGGSDYDNGILIQEESDGYLIGATTESSDGDITTQNGEFDIWLVKLDKDGSTLWQKTYGGADTEFLNAIISDNNGGYYIGATTFSNGGDISYLNGKSDIWIFKIDEDHEITNTTNIGGSSYDALLSMDLDNDELTLYGTSSSNDGDIVSNNGALDFIQIKLNTNLEIQEQNCYGNTTNEQLYVTTPFSEGTLLSGSVFSENWSASTTNSYKNIYIERIGATTWEKKLGGANSDILTTAIITNDTITVLAQTSSQTGDVTSNNGGADIWLLELSPNGEITKNKTFGGTYDEQPRIIKSLPDGGWLIGATSKSYDGDVGNNCGEKDVWLLRLDKNFNIVSSNTYGGSYDENIIDMQVIDNNNVIIFGTTSSDDYSISGLHDKIGESNDIWIFKTEF